ncbi:MAG: autotransporter-associated beta strand repeat-containing protein [Candidatus Omnitrophota bacterium]
MRKIWAIGTAFLFFHFSLSSLYALPSGETVEAGNASFERPDASTLNITASNGTIINFSDFNIAPQESVNFNAFDPALASYTNVLSRVSGINASDLLGTLNANLNLFLVNTNGIHFASSCRVNANNFVASTLDISTNNFIDGNYILQHTADGSYARILNEGRMNAGNIALVASAVENTGLIIARAGTAHLSCGDKVTVSFDERGLIQVEIDEETSGKVVDLKGNTVKDAIANSGSIEAREVVMSSKTASGIFENAVNQTGIVKAAAMTQEGGVIKIRSNRDIQVSGTLEASQGQIHVSSNDSVSVKAELKTSGNTEITADKDIVVSADIAAFDGDLSLIADADLDGAGSFRQAEGTLISSVNYGDILIQSSGEGSLANIISAGDLILVQGGLPAIFTQQPDSYISTIGSMMIGRGVAVKAANTHYAVGKDFMNLGGFNAQNSLVEMASDKAAIISGDITFNDLKIIVPGKKVAVTAGDTITVVGDLTVRGSYGNLVALVSTQPGEQWKILPQGGTDIVYTQIGDCFNARGPPLMAIHSSSLGNNCNLDLDPYWTGEGASLNWSDPDNWDTGSLPTEFDTATFDGVTGTNPNKDSYIDPDFNGTVARFVIEGYAGVITLGRDITVTGDIILASGSLKAREFTISIGGNWVNAGGHFQAGNSTVVFYDASRSSLIAGNNTFYNFTCVTAAKKLYFEAGYTTTISAALKLQGAYAEHVRLLSSEQAEQWYIDPQGPRDISYTWVEDSYNLDPVKVLMAESTNRGNCFNWDPTGTWTGTLSNLWSVAGNWIGLGGAAPGAGDDLVFPASGLTLSTSNDFAAATAFNSITITGSGYTLAGNSINLGAGGLTANFPSGSNTISLNIAFDATRTITVSNSDESLTISGVISGGAGVGLTKAGIGTLVLSGVNTYQGATAVNAGTISIAADSGLGAAPGGATAGHLTLNGGTLLTSATFSLNSNRGVALGAGNGIINVDASTVLTYGGIIAGANTLEKTGAGELVLQGINTNSSTVTINGGTVTLSGANGTMTGATFTVNQGGTLTLDNSTNNNTNRISDTNILTLTGGEFIFKGNNAAANATETVGALTLSMGASHVTVFSGTGQTVLTFASASRSAGATVLFRGANLGSNPGSGNTNIKFTNATGLSLTGGGGAAGTTNISIVPFAFGDTSVAGAGISFVTHNIDTNGNTNGIRPLVLATEYILNSVVAGSAGRNVRITAATNAATTVSINSLLVDGANLTFNTNTRTLTVASGAVARVSAGDIASTTSTSRILAFGAKEGIFFAVGSFNLAPRVSGSAGITISGGGTITFPSALSADNIYTGMTTINEGGLLISNANAVSSASSVTVAAPGTLTVGNVALSITSLILYSGNTSGASLIKGTGALTLLAAGGGSVTLNVNGSGAVGASITGLGTGTLALGASRTFTVNDGNASDDLTVAIPISGSSFGITKAGSGTLALNKANTYTGITTLNEGTLSVAIMSNGSRASGVGQSTNAATNLVLNGGTFKYTGVTVSTNRLFTIGTTSPVTIDASGVGALTFTGASITLSGTNTARTITFSGSGNAVLTNVITNNGTGVTTIVKNGTGTWSFKGVNTYTGTVAINAGTLAVNSDSGLGSAPGSATPASITFNGGTLQTSASFTLNSNRGIALTGDGSLSSDVSTTLTYAGIIAGSGILTKEGLGTLDLQGTNTYSSPTVINNGTLTYSGANGAALNSTSFNINPEATLILDNTSANNFDRIGDDVEIRMNGGNFNFIGCSSASAFETTGELRITTGSNYVSVRDSTGGATVMTFSSFSRIAGAMVLFRGTNFGSSPADNVSTIMFTAAPALTGAGGAAGSTTVSIIQGAFGSGSPTGLGTDMVTYNIADNPFGLRLLNEGGFSGEYETSVLTVPNSNVKLSGSVAPGAGITINSLILESGGAVASSANTLTIGSGNILALSGNAGINGTSVLAFGASPGIIRAVANLTISSQVTGSAGLTTGGAGIITLSNAGNSFTGDIRISQGTVSVSADANLGLGSGSTNITLAGGALQTTASFTLSSSRGIFLKGPGSISVDTSTILTYDGVISGPHSLTKDGSGSLLLGGTNTYAGDTTVNAGTLTLSGSNRYSGATTINNGELILSGASGQARRTSSVTINAGGTLTLDNASANNTNRIADGATFNMNGGIFNFIGSGSAAATESIGDLALISGLNYVSVTPGAGGATTLTCASLTRNSGAAVVFRGSNLGVTPAANVSTLYFNDEPALVGGGGAAGSFTVSIISGAFGDSSLSGSGTDMVTYDSIDNGGYGLRLLAPGEYGATFTANYNVKLAGSVAPTVSVTIASLILTTGGVVNSSTRTLTISSGNILNTSATGILTNTTVIAFGVNEGNILNTNNLTIRSNMTGTAGVTYSGTGTTTLNTLVKGLTGMTTINSGTLIVGIANAINSAGSVTVAPGATFTNGNFAETITNLILYSGSAAGATVTTGTGNLTLLAAGGGSVTVNVNGSGAYGSRINTTATGMLALGASRIFTVNDGNAADDLTVSTIISGNTFGITKNGAGTLVLSGVNTYTGANTINAGTLAVTANNALGTAAGNTTVNAGTLDFRNIVYSTAEALILATDSNLITSTGTSSFAGTITMTAPSTIEVSGTQLTLSGAVANGGFRLTVAGASNTIISNTLTGAGGLAKQGTGSLTLSNTVTLGGNLTISRGSLIAGANTITVSGNWTNNAVFTCGTSTVTFNGGSATIDSGGTGNGQDFFKVVVNSTGTKTLADALMVNDVLQVDGGVLAGDYDVTVKGGSITGNGAISMTDGTFTVQGTGNFGGSTSDWTFYNLTFGDAVTTATTTKTGSNTVNVTGTLAVTLHHTLLAGSSTWNLVWTSYLKNITMIASGYDHTVALTDDGYVFSWGSNVYGQLGDGTTADGLTPVQVLSGEQGGGTYLHNVSKISAGGYHSVALADDGSLYDWGYNGYGQLGNNETANSLTPVRVHGVGDIGNLSGITEIAAGGFETAAVGSGFVYCWGYNGEGELGNNSIVDSHVPVQVLSGAQGGGTYLHNISKVAVGGCQVLALVSDGTVFSWGYNGDGELGDGTTNDRLVPVQVLSGEQGGGSYLHSISQISAGDAHSLALANSGFVYSWGYNNEGQLGNGTVIDAHSPVRVLSGEQGNGVYLQNVSNISAGAAHSLAIASGAYVFSWGQNHGPLGEPWGQLGNGSTTNSSSPVRVLSGDQGSETYLHDIAAIAAGGAQTVALSHARPVFNCGNNARGQLGNGTTVGVVEQIRVQAGSQAGPVFDQLVVSGILTTQTSTFNFANLYQPNINIAALTYNNLILSNSNGTYWLTGTTNVLGNVVIDNATLSADSYTLNVSGNWTNTDGVFNAGTGTVVLNSSAQSQTVTSGGSAFNILTITNSYVDGIIFGDRLITGTLNASTGVQKLSFSSASLSSPHTITASFNVSGSAGNLIELAPLVSETAWYIETPVSTLHHLKIGYSYVVNSTITATNSQDNTGNYNWNISP